MEWSIWEQWVVGFLVLVVFSFIAGFIDVACEQRKKRKEQEERERLQMKGYPT